jgi:dephospho-CoA kinase
MKVIAVTGMPGSGKGEVAEVARSMQLKVYSMGDVVRSYFSNNFPDRSPIETGMYADMERQKHGEDIWARRLIGTVENELEPHDEIVIIDGLRSKSEVELFKGHWGPNFRILAVHSSPDTRYFRLSERGRGDDSRDRRKFDQRDERELGWGLGEVISLADIMLINETVLDEFGKMVEERLNEEKVGE